VQNATVDQLYKDVLEKLRGDLSQQAGVDVLRLFSAGTDL